MILRTAEIQSQDIPSEPPFPAYWQPTPTLVPQWTFSYGGAGLQIVSNCTRKTKGKRKSLCSRKLLNVSWLVNKNFFPLEDHWFSLHISLIVYWWMVKFRNFDNWTIWKEQNRIQIFNLRKGKFTFIYTESTVRITVKSLNSLKRFILIKSRRYLNLAKSQKEDDNVLPTMNNILKKYFILWNCSII